MPSQRREIKRRLQRWLQYGELDGLRLLDMPATKAWERLFVCQRSLCSLWFLSSGRLVCNRCLHSCKEPTLPRCRDRPLIGPCMKPIARLNDEFRATFEGGKVLITASVQALSVDVRAAAIVAVQGFTVFTKDSDPYGEHDCATFTLNGQRFFWAIDYYDETCTYRSRDPCDEFMTTRVLTLMLAQDY